MYVISVNPSSKTFCVSHSAVDWFIVYSFEVGRQLSIKCQPIHLCPCVVCRKRDLITYGAMLFAELVMSDPNYGFLAASLT